MPRYCIERGEKAIVLRQKVPFPDAVYPPAQELARNCLKPESRQSPRSAEALTPRIRLL
jgi:hypothetical protein